MRVVDFVAVSTAIIALITGSGSAIADDMLIADGSDDEALLQRLTAALDARGEDYKPRSEHIDADGSPHYLNRLILEDSPYLLQHAHNPVNWYPWGEEAFSAARRADKPIFLSIGYATCHWCHVMERESFENLEIAARMNRDFISIKVDREQLPDIDAFYMTGVMIISGRGGWPMSSFIDADGRPFYGATYFPPDEFFSLLDRVATLWHSERETLLAQAGEIADVIAANSKLGEAARKVGAATIEIARRTVLGDVDELEGGFGHAPKFPREPTHIFLLDQALRHGDESALMIVDETLHAMTAGGIHDHVGGGFHRYAVDSAWLIPHFEKMLYNQAAMTRIYAQAAELTGDAEHARTARRTLDYVLRDMTSPEGLFYSATDADSEGEEGRFFVWTPAELDEVLEEGDSTLAQSIWNVTEAGNFEGHSILNTDGALVEVAEKHELSVSELMSRMSAWSESLRIHREKREPPLRDEKILTAWNGMMITALVEGAERLAESRYLDAGYRAGDAIWRTMTSNDGASLFRTRFEGRSTIPGTQPDYAYLAEAMLALYDATGEQRWLERATVLADSMIQQFLDPVGGGFFMGAAKVGGKTLAARPKDLQDNAMASGNSVALRVLARLAVRTGEPRFADEADALIAAVSASLERAPTGFLYLLTGVSEHLYGEQGARQYAARGRVKAEAKVSDGEVVVTVTIAPGWHINAHQPLQDYLIPTVLAGSEGVVLDAIDYPEPETRRLSFQKEPLALHEESVVLVATLPEGLASRRNVALELGLQACSDEVCLAPESIELRVPLDLPL